MAPIAQPHSQDTCEIASGPFSTLGWPEGRFGINCCLGGEERREQAKLWVRGGVNSFPPFFRIGLFLLSEDGWGSEKAFDPFGDGGFSPPLEERLLRMRTAAAMLLVSQFQFLASLIPNQIESTVATKSLVHRKDHFISTQSPPPKPFSVASPPNCPYLSSTPP
jgi:hypothetical protein